MILSMPNKALSKRSAKQTASDTVNVYASINADDLKLVDQAAATAKPRPISRSMMIATIVNQWADQHRPKGGK
jgi:hypothetical protein